jgi:uncharacterized damage-inducible protein DinB
MDLNDIKHLFDYTEWANALALQSAGILSDEDLRRDFGISHKSIFGTLLHMAGAEWIWLERWHGRSPARDEAWPRWSEESCVDLTELQERWQGVNNLRATFIGELDQSRLAEDMAFKLLNGDASSMRLGHQMQHVVNHATLHRGQVVGMIRQLGIDPPATDLLFYIRQ